MVEGEKDVYIFLCRVTFTIDYYIIIPPIMQVAQRLPPQLEQKEKRGSRIKASSNVRRL